MGGNSNIKYQNERRANDPELKARYFDEYRDSVDLKNGLLAAESFNAYTKKRMSSALAFTEVKTPDGETLAKKLSANTPEAKAVQDKIAKALELAIRVKEQQTQFNATMSYLNGRIKQNPPEFSCSGISSELAQIKSGALTAVKEQQTQETERLMTLFEQDNGFKSEMKASLGIDDNQLESIKDEMLTALKTNQKKEQDALEKEINKSITNLQSDLRKEFWRITFLADRYRHDEQMRKEIDALIRKKRGKAHIPVSVSINMDSGIAIFKGISLDELTIVNGIAGKPIYKNEDGSYSVQLNRLWQSEESVRIELTSLAQWMIGRGCTTIEMSLTCNDPSKAAELGRRGYEACIAAGFPPKCITIKVNGVIQIEYDAKNKIQKDDLFKEKDTKGNIVSQQAYRLQETERKAKEIAAMVEKHTQNPTGSREIKEGVRKMREAEEVATNADQANAPGTTSTSGTGPT